MRTVFLGIFATRICQLYNFVKQSQRKQNEVSGRKGLHRVLKQPSSHIEKTYGLDCVICCHTVCFTKQYDFLSFLALKTVEMSDLEVEICEISVMAIYLLSPRRLHVIMIKMAGVCETLTGSHQNKAIDSCEDLDKILSVVVKRRKTIPAKCMKINKQLYEYDISRLENAKVITEEDINKVKFKSTSREILQGFKELKSTPLTLDDIQEAEEKLRKLYERAIQINSYLEKRKRFVNNF